MIQSKTDAVTQIAPCNDFWPFFLDPERACEPSQADASNAQKPINQLKALIIADKNLQIHDRVPLFAFPSPSALGWGGVPVPTG